MYDESGATAVGPYAAATRVGNARRRGCVQKHLRLEHGVVVLHVKEQRLSNLLQALLVGACIVATPAVRRIPKSVLWGYFAFMAVDSLPGSQFWDRLLLLLRAPRERCVRARYASWVIE